MTFTWDMSTKHTKHEYGREPTYTHIHLLKPLIYSIASRIITYESDNFQYKMIS